jgi:hypothetical protein
MSNDITVSLNGRHTWGEAREIKRKIETHRALAVHREFLTNHEVTMAKLDNELTALPLRHAVEVGKLNIELDTMEAQHRNRMLKLQLENAKLEAELAATLKK